MKNTVVWVLGNGQLGAMLCDAGKPLGIDVRPIDIMASSSTQLSLNDDDFVTAEREEWPETPLSLQLSQHHNFINKAVFNTLANRQYQKKLLDDLTIPTAPWLSLDRGISTSALYQKLGSRVLLKRSTGGYDGKGQHWLNQSDQTIIPNDWFEQSIAEQGIDFDEEVSLVGARTRDGKCHFYPLTLNYHQNGILMASIAPFTRLDGLTQQAENMLTDIMEHLNYVGVMAMECFRVKNKLLVNELAPRVHNSGHWTQSGSHINQFEMHLRALCDLPIAKLNFEPQIVMINLIGVEKNQGWLTIPNAKLFWYDKEVREGRKVGHLNIAVDDNIIEALNSLSSMLPINYQQTLVWVANELG